jgi:hypothetical protein
MARSSEQPDKNEFSEAQIRDYADGKSDTASVTQVNDLRDEILKKIAGAENDGIISRTDAVGLRNRLNETKRETSAVSKIDSEVSRVIEDSKSMIREFTGDKTGQKEVMFFKELSVEEKRTYLSRLKEEAEGLQKRFEGLKKYMPEADGGFSYKTGIERAKCLEELNCRRDNTYRYADLLDKNRICFSATEVDEQLGGFKDLSVNQQGNWLKDFEDKQLRPREKLVQRYDSLPQDYREQLVNFSGLNMQEKEAAVEKTEQEIKFNGMVDSSPQSVNISRNSKKYAKEGYRKAPPSLRKEMMDMLFTHFAAEQALFTEFDKQPEEAKRRYPDFVELSFEKKQYIVKSLEKHDDNLRTYDLMLEKAVKDKVMSEATRDKYVSWFKERSLKDKETAINGFENEIKPRKELLERFEKELPDAVKRDNKRFYDLGHQDRMEMLEKLLTENAKKETKEEANEPEAKEKKKAGAELSAEQLKAMAARAVNLHQNGKVEQASAMYQTILIYDQDNEEAKLYLSCLENKSPKKDEKAEDLDDNAVADGIRNAKNEGSMLKKRKLLSVAGGIAGLVRNSDLSNQGRIHSSDKDTHLDDKERRLNHKVLEFTGGRVMAGHKHEKAQKIRRVDFNKLQSMEEGDVGALKDEVLSHQGDKANTAHHIQLEDKKTSREIAGASGVSWSGKAEKALRAEMLSDAQQRLERDSRKLSEIEKARLKAQIEKEDISVDLREAA